MNQQDFVSTYGGLANDVAQRTGLDPNLVMGLVAQETGWGDHAVGSNVFGIMNGPQVKQYDHVGQSAEDFISLINRRYPGAAQGKTAPEQALALVRGGYNTADPGYAHHLAMNAAHISQITGSQSGTQSGSSGTQSGSQDGTGGDTGDTTGQIVAQMAPAGGHTGPVVRPGTPAPATDDGGDGSGLSDEEIRRRLKAGIQQQQTQPGAGGAGSAAPVEKSKETPPPTMYPPGSVGAAIEQANQGIPGWMRPPGAREETGTSPFSWKRRNMDTGETYNVVPEFFRAPIAGATKTLTGEPYQAWGSDPDIGSMFLTMLGMGHRSPVPGAMPVPTPGAPKPNPLIAETPAAVDPAAANVEKPAPLNPPNQPQPMTPSQAGMAQEAASWREVQPGETFQPGREFRVDVKSGKQFVKEPQAAPPQASPGENPPATQQPYVPPTQAQVNQMAQTIGDQLRQWQKANKSGLFGAIGDTEFRNIIRGGLNYFLPAPVRMVVDGVETAYTMLRGRYRGRRGEKAIDDFQNDLQKQLSQMYQVPIGPSDGAAAAPGGIGSPGPYSYQNAIIRPSPGTFGGANAPQPGLYRGSGGMSPPAPTVGPQPMATQPVSRMAAGAVGGTPSANAQQRNRLVAPPGMVDLRNRLILRQ